MSKIRKITDTDFWFFCPGCNQSHVFQTTRWRFNNDMDKPTLAPSYLVYENKEVFKLTNGRYGHRCHSFVVQGQIKFLGDCTHELKEQTVDLPEITDEMSLAIDYK